MDGLMEFEPRISVALVTRNRPESLLRTLRSLAQQDAQPWEVVVSDDSDEGPASEVQRIAEGFGFRYLRGPRRGLYANRNHVALACAGTHIRMMDDDHEFPPGHFRLCAEAVRKDPAAVWFISEMPNQKDGGYVCPGQLHPRGFASFPAEPDNCWSIADGASLYPSGIFQRGIRYAEYYKFGAAYLEFGSRLYWLGYRMRFLASTGVIHHYDPQERSFMNEEMNRSSRLFAAMCHSFLYQPTVRNQALCCLQIAREVAVGNGYRCWRSALSAYRDHKRTLAAQFPAEAERETSLQTSR